MPIRGKTRRSKTRRSKTHRNRKYRGGGVDEALTDAYAKYAEEFKKKYGKYPPGFPTAPTSASAPTSATEYPDLYKKSNAQKTFLNLQEKYGGPTILTTPSEKESASWAEAILSLGTTNKKFAELCRTVGTLGADNRDFRNFCRRILSFKNPFKKNPNINSNNENN